jgi:WD40 repeat protein
LWNVRTGTLSRTIALDADLVGYYVTFSPDGRTVAVTAGPSADAVTSLAVTPPYVYVVRQWDVATGKVLVTTSYNIKDASTDPFPGGPSVFSPDSTLLATPLSVGSIELRQARTGVKVGGLVGRQGFVTALAFNQDGTMLASGGSNRTLLLWDVATRRPVGTPLVGHNGAITGVAFLPDGRTLASVSDFDTTLRLWDIPVHAPLAVVQGTAGSFNGIAVQPGTGLIATAANNDAVVVWNADPAGVLGTVCQALRGPQSMADAWKAIGGDPSRAPRC